MIEVKTILGEGSILENTNLVHGKPLNKSDIEQLKQKLNIPTSNAFYVNNEAKEYLMKTIFERTDKVYTNWSKCYHEFQEGSLISKKENYNFILNKQYDFDILNYDFGFLKDTEDEMRNINNKVMNEIAKNVPNFIGGSADLNTSCMTHLNSSDISGTDYSGKNINFGLRENAMGSILNGLALYNYKVFGSTFLSFSDFLRPSLRMTSMLNLPVTYIFTHDSISIGPDGPTHQPIEQLSNLRNIPNLFVYRPCDIAEVVGCWNEILKNNKPSALVISKESVRNVGIKENVKYGAYIIRKEITKLAGIIISSGTDVLTAVKIADELYEQYKIDIRVISMPSKELYKMQSINYKTSLFPIGVKKIFIEASNYKEDYCYNINLNNYGISGNKEDVLKYMHFDYKTIKNEVLNYFGSKKMSS